MEVFHQLANSCEGGMPWVIAPANRQQISSPVTGGVTSCYKGRGLFDFITHVLQFTWASLVHIWLAVSFDAVYIQGWKGFSVSVN